MSLVKRRPSTMLDGRQYAVKVDGATITFECQREGHTYSIDFSSKRRPIAQRFGASGARMFASWWSRDKGGCIGTCPKCVLVVGVVKK